MADDAVKKIRSIHAALMDATGDGKPVEVFAVHTDAARRVVAKHLKQGDNLKWCSMETPK